MTRNEKYMTLALQQAQLAMELGEVPVGAVVVHRNRVIAQAYNTREAHNNALAHAEITAIHEACIALGSWRLQDCELFVTLEPCPMCAGASINARISRIIYGASDPKAGCAGSVTDLFRLPFNHKPEVIGGVLEQSCAKILHYFFKDIRKLYLFSQS